MTSKLIKSDLMKKVKITYRVLDSLDGENELLRYFICEGDSFKFAPHSSGEFRERFGPKVHIEEWHGGSIRGYVNYISPIAFRKYLKSLEKAIEEIN